MIAKLWRRIGTWGQKFHDGTVPENSVYPPTSWNFEYILSQLDAAGITRGGGVKFETAVTYARTNTSKHQIEVGSQLDVQWAFVFLCATLNASSDIRIPKVWLGPRHICRVHLASRFLGSFLSTKRSPS